MVLILDIDSAEVFVGEGLEMDLESHSDIAKYAHAMRLLGQHLRPDHPACDRNPKPRRFPTLAQRDGWNCGPLALLNIGAVLQAALGSTQKLPGGSYSAGVGVVVISEADYVESCIWLRLTLAIELFRAHLQGATDHDHQWLPNVIFLHPILPRYVHTHTHTHTHTHV